MSSPSAVSAKLIFPTKEIVEEYYLPIIYTACRTCYSEQLPDQIWDKAVSRGVADEKQQALVRKVMESGHGSTIEHVNFTFAIRGVTRTLSHQLVRHRAGTAFDQQSQRYVSFKKRDNYTIPDSIANGDLPDDLAGRFQAAVDANMDLYGQLLQAEVPAEDARFIFPNAVQTNLIMTVNLRQLIHMSGPAPLHHGPVGDPPALQADPPRDLPGVARSSGRSSPPSACRSATATRWATATSTAASGRTATR